VDQTSYGCAILLAMQTVIVKEGRGKSSVHPYFISHHHYSWQQWQWHGHHCQVTSSDITLRVIY